MKPSEALAPLSRDHHKALVVAAKLAWVSETEAPFAAREYVRFFAEHELTHFALEESVLLPVVSPEGPGSVFAKQILDDHGVLRDAMRRLRDWPDDANVAFLREIGARLRSHVRMEERRFFPYLEETLDEATLEAIGARLRAAHG